MLLVKKLTYLMLLLNALHIKIKNKVAPIPHRAPSTLLADLQNITRATNVLPPPSKTPEYLFPVHSSIAEPEIPLAILYI
jgi:hypothetical protein